MADDYDVRKEWRRVQVLRGPSIAQALSLADSGSWVVKPQEDDEHTARNLVLLNVANPDEQVCIGLDEYEKRLTIGGFYPALPDGRPFWPRDHRVDVASPSVTAAKTDAQVAADIIRRFLPSYRAALVVYTERVAQQVSYINAGKDASERIYKVGRKCIGPMHPKRDSQSEYHATIDAESKGISHGSIDISGDHVRIEMSVSVDFAEAFAHWLATL